MREYLASCCIQQLCCRALFPFGVLLPSARQCLGPVLLLCGGHFLGGPIVCFADQIGLASALSIVFCVKCASVVHAWTRVHIETVTTHQISLLSYLCSAARSPATGVCVVRRHQRAAVQHRRKGPNRRCGTFLTV